MNTAVSPTQGTATVKSDARLFLARWLHRLWITVLLLAVFFGVFLFVRNAHAIHSPRPHNAIFDLVMVTEVVATCPSDPPGAQCRIIEGAVIHACDVEFDPSINTFFVSGCLAALHRSTS